MKDYKNARNDKYLEELEIKYIPLLPSFVKDYFIKLRSDGKTALTQLEYARDILSFIQYISENLRSDNSKKERDITLGDIERVMPKDIVEYITYLQAKRKDAEDNYSPVTIKRKLSVIRAFYKYYYQQGKIHTNPAERVELPKLKKVDEVALGDDEVAKILDAAKIDTRDYAMLVIFISTRISVSELVGLDIDDYDTKQACFHVIRKGNKDEKVSYSSAVEEAMRAYLLDRQNKSTKAGHEYALFLSNRGSRITVRNVEYMVKKYGELAISKDVKPQTLRKADLSMSGASEKTRGKSKSYSASELTGLGQMIAEKTRIETYIELVKEGLLTEEKAAEKAGMDIADFRKALG